MSKREARLYKYQVRFRALTKKMHEEQNQLYNTSIVAIRLEELQNKGGYVEKVYSPTAKGTLINFRVIESEEEYKEQFNKIVEDVTALGLELKERRENK